MADSKPASTQQPTSAEGVPLNLTPGLDPGLASMLSPEALKARQDLLDDWTQYVAVEDIPHGGVLAYPAGAPVPASNVKRWQYDKLKLVVKRDSAEGRAAVKAAEPLTPSTAKAPGDPD